MKKLCSGILLLIMLFTAFIPTLALDLRTNSPQEIVNAMSAQEKAWMLVGAAPYQTVHGAAGTTYGIPRFGVPTTSVIDGPIGVSRFGTVTAMPGLHIMASTWNTDLIYEAGVVLGDETAKLGFDGLLGPGAEIQRNPLGGRNADYFSEDPVQTGLIGSAYVNGLQSKDVMASVKHYAGNVAETLRERNDTVVGERALREVYLRNYELICKLSNPGNLMTTYNLINNEFVTASPALLTNIAKNEWNYGGIFITDWFSGDGTGYLSTPILDYEYEYGAWMQTVAGCHIQMPGGSTGTPIDRRNLILNAINSSPANMAQANKLCVDILNYVKRTATFKGTLKNGAINYEANAAVARRVAEEGSVLLKNNDKTLPIKKSDEVALFGYPQIDTLITGGGSAAINEDTRYRTVRIQQGFTNAGIALNNDVKAFYNSGSGEVLLSSSLIDNASKASDIAMYVVRKSSSEWQDRGPNTNEYGYYLTETIEQNMIAISNAFHAQGKKLVVIINSTGPIDVANWEEYADAIVYIGTLGNETGTSLVNLLTGDSNFSGKLAQIFPKNYFDVPGSDEFPGVLSPSGFYYNTNREFRTTHINEGIYVGHRYFTTFDKETSYPFGHGLSYTDFAFSNMTVNGKTAFSTKTNPFVYTGGDLKVTVDVTNIGDVPGKEVAQLYVHASETALEVPEVELKGFAKTGMLYSGQTQTLTITITPELMKSYQPDGAKWIIPAGKYELRLGRDSEYMLENACFIVENDILVQQVTNQGTNAHSNSQLNEISKGKDGGLFDVVYINDTWEYDNTVGTSPFGQAIEGSGFYKPVTVVNGKKTFTKTITKSADLQLLKFIGEGASDTKVYMNGEYLAGGEIINVKIKAPQTETITITVESSAFGMEVKGVFAALKDITPLVEKINEANGYLSGNYSKSSLAALSNAVFKAEDMLQNGLTTEKLMRDAIDRLQAAINGLEAPKPEKDPYSGIMAINIDKKSDVIRVEDDNSSLGWVANQTWVAYEEVAFGDEGADKLTISYGTPVGYNGHIRITLDDLEVGEIILKTYLHNKSTTWKDFRQETFQLSRTIRGTHDLYIAFFEDNGGSCGNFEYFKFHKTEQGSKAYIEANIEKVRDKQITADGAYKTHLTDCIMKLNQYLSMNTISANEETLAKTIIDQALSEKSEFNFYYETLTHNQLFAYEEGSIAEINAILASCKAFYENQSSTENLENYIAIIKSAFDCLKLRTDYPYRTLDATIGTAIGDPFTIKDGYLSVLNAAAKVDYGVMDFGKSGSSSMTIHYRNADNSVMNIYFYNDIAMITPFASLVLRNTSEEGVEETISLNTVLTGENNIYAKVVGKGNAGVDTFRFIEKETKSDWDSVVDQTKGIVKEKTNDNAYNSLTEFITLTASWKENLQYISQSFQQNLTDVLTFFTKEASMHQNPWREGFDATCWDEASGSIFNVQEDGILHTTHTQNGDYIVFKNLNFGDNGADSVTIGYSCPNTGSGIEIRTESPQGPILASYTFNNTGSWATYTTDTIHFYTPILGTNSIYIVFRHSANQTDFCNLSTLTFHPLDEKYTVSYGGKNPFALLPAVNCDVRSESVWNVSEKDASGHDITFVGSIEKNDYIGFVDYDFTKYGAVGIRMNVASMSADAIVTVRLDSPSGPVVGSYTVGTTGGWTEFKDKTYLFSLPITGKRSVYLVFYSNQATGDFMNLKDIQFIRGTVSYINGASAQEAERIYEFISKAQIKGLSDMPLVLAEAYIIENLSQDVISALGEDRYAYIVEKKNKDLQIMDAEKANAYTYLLPVFSRIDSTDVSAKLTKGLYVPKLYGIYEENLQWIEESDILIGVYQKGRLVRVTSSEEVDITDNDTELRAFVWNSKDQMNPKTNAGVLSK